MKEMRVIVKEHYPNCFVVRTIERVFGNPMWNVVAENDVTDDIMNIIASRMPKDVVSKPVEEVETVQQMDDDIEDMNDDEYDEMVSK